MLNIIFTPKVTTLLQKVTKVQNINGIPDLTDIESPPIFFPHL